MLEKIDETLRILAEYNAPEDIVEQVQEMRKRARLQPTIDCTYDMVMLFNKHIKRYEWAENAIQVWTGKMAKYDPARENPNPFLGAASAMSGDTQETGSKMSLAEKLDRDWEALPYIERGDRCFKSAVKMIESGDSRIGGARSFVDSLFWYLKELMSRSDKMSDKERIRILSEFDTEIHRDKVDFNLVMLKIKYALELDADNVDQQSLENAIAVHNVLGECDNRTYITDEWIDTVKGAATGIKNLLS